MTELPLTELPTRYFDHAATSPLRPEAKAAWLEHAVMLNPAGQYALGRTARRALETARESIAEALGCEPIEVIFTGSGTEANNLAVRGLWERTGRGRVVASPLEHPSVLETVQHLPGVDPEWLPLADDGRVDATSLGVLDTPAAVATCMWANNETGALQPVRQVCEAAAVSGTPVHVDAVQVAGHLPIDFSSLGATTMALSAHKFGGPRGVGLLIARRSPAPEPVIRGGGQERGIRSGTVDVASAAATAAALRACVAEQTQESERIAALRDEVRAFLQRQDHVVIHSPKHDCLPGHLHCSIEGAEADSVLMLLDRAGFAASSGSACSNGVHRASHVLLAMGVPEAVARGALRLTFGQATTSEDVRELIEVLPETIRLARLAGMSTAGG